MMNRIFSYPFLRGLFLTGFLALGLGAGGAQAVDIQIVKSPGGIEAWLVEEHSIPLIAVEFSFKGGARLDAEGKEGLTNFLSLMLDEGAGDLDSQTFQKKLTDKSISMGFNASRDHFSGSFRTLSRYKDDAFELLRLAINEPRFDQPALERMRGQIGSSLARQQQDPNSIASLAWFKASFPDQPYGRPRVGTKDSIAAITADDLRAVWKQQMVRDRIKITVVGDITAGELARRLDALFGDLPVAGKSIEKQAQFAPMKIVDVIERDQPQSVVMFGLQGLMREDPDFIPAYVLNYILGGGGFASRLTIDIREKRGLVYSVYSYLYAMDEAGLWIGGLATTNDQVGQALDLVRENLSMLVKDGVSDEELKNAKTYLTGSFPLRFDSNAKIANNLLGLQLAGRGVDYVNKRNGLIEAVTVKDIHRVAKRLFDPANLRVVAVGKPDGLL